MSSASPPVTGRRLWLLRLLALLMVPLAFVFVELALRLLGVGYETRFLVPAESGQLISNADFGRRFFPPTLARPPVPFTLDARKADATRRIFLVGGSAARGTPEPAFGVARLLEAELASEGERFEVVNAAMTAINSHVALEIVRDVVNRGDADQVLVYLGNNEVVGPWGAASVLGDFTPSRRLVRLGVRLRALRLGQLIDGLLAESPPAGGWRGMEMFLEQRIGADDPRLEKVYANFEANLEDMVHVARRAGVPIALSTVAVNLRDQPPFASHAVSDEERADFDERYDEARRQLLAGRPAEALAAAEAMIEEEDRHAGAHHLRGLALLAGGSGAADPETARRALEKARDLDMLRFRADGQINETIRRVAERQKVPLVDAAETFAGALAGRRHFLEHVHLRFEGNLALARLLRDVVLAELPDAPPEKQTAPEAAPSAIAQRVAFTPADALTIEREMLELVRRPPFHPDAADLRLRHAQIQQLQRTVAAPQSRAQIERLYLARLEKNPDDLLTRRRWAEILGDWGQAEKSLEHWRALTEAMPSVLPWQRAHATALVRSDRAGEADAVVEEVAKRFGPRAEAEIRIDLGTAFEAERRLGRAGEQYRKARELDPTSPLPPFNLAMLAAQRGEIERAIEAFEQILRDHPDFAPALQNLGVAHEKKGELEKAEQVYRREISMRPEAAEGFYRLGVLLRSQGRIEEALEAFAGAIKRQPDHAPSYFQVGDFHLGRGEARRAIAFYREGLAYRPQDARAQDNLRRAVALLQGAAGELRE